MADLRLEGKLGVETVSPLRGCCINTIIKWRPQLIGQKCRCMFCDNPLKTIRAGEEASPEWTGLINETRIERAVPEFALATMWFSDRKFSSVDNVNNWCSERGMTAKGVSFDGMAYRVDFAKTVNGTERAVWAAPGVIAVVGILKMDTGDMAGGGSLHPLQQGVAEPRKDEKEEETKTEPAAEKNETMDIFEKAVANFSSSLNKVIA
jgi:hypothetical protein